MDRYAGFRVFTLTRSLGGALLVALASAGCEHQGNEQDPQFANQPGQQAYAQPGQQQQPGAPGYGQQQPGFPQQQPGGYGQQPGQQQAPQPGFPQPSMPQFGPQPSQPGASPTPQLGIPGLPTPAIPGFPSPASPAPGPSPSPAPGATPAPAAPGGFPFPFPFPGGGGLPGAPGGSPGQVPSSGAATPIDPNLASVATVPLMGYSQQEAPGMMREGTLVAGNFREGQTLEQPFQMLPGKCYTVLAVGAGITQVDLAIVAVTPIPQASGVLTQTSGGSNASLNGRGNCFRWELPVGINAKLVIRAARGQGIAAGQLYSK